MADATDKADFNYLTDRLESQQKWYSKKSGQNQKWYRCLKIVEIVSASAIPLLSGYSNHSPYIPLIIAVLGASIAIAAGVEALYKYHENWITYRNTSEALKHEKMLYLTKTVPYNIEDEQKRLQELVNRAEEIMREENKNWMSYTKKDEKKEDS